MLDLDTKVSTLASGNCLTAIDDFAEINLRPFSTPVILRVLHPAMIVEPMLWPGMWLPNIAWSKNVIRNSTERTKDAMTDNCLSAEFTSLNLCTTLDLIKLPNKTKP